MHAEIPSILNLLLAESCMWKSVLSAILFIQANKKLWILPVGLVNFRLAIKGSKFLVSDFDVGSRFKKALLVSAFFMKLVRGCLLLGGLLVFALGISAPCGVLFADNASVRVDYVIDGDTVILNDNRKVRLIGINAPEQESGNRAAQPFAMEARLALQQLVMEREMRLIEGIDAVDRYGRTLAYLELEDGTDVQESMLVRGYAAFVAISPNSERILRYIKAEQVARTQSLGIWSSPDYVLDSSLAGDRFDGGFAVVNSIVSQVRESASFYIFDLNSDMSFRILKSNWQLHWDSVLPQSYVSRKVEVRGWFYLQKKALVTVVSHPSMIGIL